MAKQKGKKMVAQRVLKLPKVNNIESSDADNDSSVPNVMPASVTKVVERSLCENCKTCICRGWSALVTPEISTVIQAISASIIEKTDPKTVLLNKTEVMMELCPKTNVFISENDRNWAISKANGKHRTLVAQIFSCLVDEETLLKYNTSVRFHNGYNPNIKKAIIHFVKEELGIYVKDKEYTDIINKYIQRLRKSKCHSVSVSTTADTSNETVKGKALLRMSQTGNKHGNNNKRKLDETMNGCQDDVKENLLKKNNKCMKTLEIQNVIKTNNPATSNDVKNTVEKIQEITIRTPNTINEKIDQQRNCNGNLYQNWKYRLMNYRPQFHGPQAPLNWPGYNVYSLYPFFAGLNHAPPMDLENARSDNDIDVHN